MSGRGSFWLELDASVTIYLHLLCLGIRRFLMELLYVLIINKATNPWFIWNISKVIKLSIVLHGVEGRGVENDASQHLRQLMPCRHFQAPNA